MTKLSESGFVNETAILLASSLKCNLTSFQSFDTVLKHFGKIILYNSKWFYCGVTGSPGS